MKVPVVYLLLPLLLFCCAPKEDKKKVVKKVDVKLVPKLTTRVLWFNINDKKINKVNFCKALSFALDRDYIVEAIQNGEAQSAIYGITAPVLSKVGYDITKIKGYSFNLDSARYYFKKSGVTDKYCSFRIKTVASEKSILPEFEFQKEWKEGLDIAVDIEAVPSKDILYQAASGKEGIFILPIESRELNPQGFLKYFYSGQEPIDTTKFFYIKPGTYINLRFDKYYSEGLKSQTLEEKYKNFMAAEQILIDEARVVPLWYDEEDFTKYR